MKKPTYVLDSFAVLAYFQAEPSGQEVKKLLKQARAGDALAFLSWINLGEIIYNIGRKLGDAAATDLCTISPDCPSSLPKSHWTASWPLPRSKHTILSPTPMPLPSPWRKS